MVSSYSVADMENQVSTSVQKQQVIVLGERHYPLNKSKTKFVSVGIVAECGYKPGVILSGVKGEMLIFDADEWEDFLSYQGVITNYVYSHEKTETVHGWTFSIHFEQISHARVVKIEKGASQIYLGYETICKLWEVLSLVKYNQNLFSKQDFATYFKFLCYGLKHRGDNLFQAVEDMMSVTEPCPTENPLLVLEYANIYPEEFEKECGK